MKLFKENLLIIISFIVIIPLLTTLNGCPLAPTETSEVTEDTTIEEVESTQEQTIFFQYPFIDYPIGKQPDDGLYWDCSDNDFGAYLRTWGGKVYNGFHPGEDWNLKGGKDGNIDLGEKVYAIGEGKVVKISKLNGNLGMLVAIKHEGSFIIPDHEKGWYKREKVDTVYSVYEHIDNLDEFKVTLYQDVNENTRLGRIMNPGGGPHLHLEIRLDDEQKNNWSADWSLVDYRDGGYQKKNAYFIDLQKMIDAGLRDPSDFIEANSKISEIEGLEYVTTTSEEQEEEKQFKYDVIYSVRTEETLMSPYEAFKKGLSVAEFAKPKTNVYRLNLETGDSSKIFSDEKLPITFHRSPGGPWNTTVMVTSLKNNKLYAFGVERENYNWECIGSLFEITTDGSNSYRKVFDFKPNPHPYIGSIEGSSLIFSYNGEKFFYEPYPDSSSLELEKEKITYASRRTENGELLSYYSIKMPSEFVGYEISFSPNGEYILILVSDLVSDYTFEDKVYILKNDEGLKEIESMFPELISKNLTGSYKISKSSYYFFPKSKKLLGLALTYVYGEHSPRCKFFVFDLESRNIQEIPLLYNKNTHRFIISPDEKFIAYKGVVGIVKEELPSGVEIEVDKYGIYIVNIETGENKLILPEEGCPVGWLSTIDK